MPFLCFLFFRAPHKCHSHSHPIIAFLGDLFFIHTVPKTNTKKIFHPALSWTQPLLPEVLPLPGLRAAGENARLDFPSPKRKSKLSAGSCYPAPTPVLGDHCRYPLSLQLFSAVPLPALPSLEYTLTLYIPGAALGPLISSAGSTWSSTGELTCFNHRAQLSCYRCKSTVLQCVMH